jgi:hypothetical protein
VTALRRALEAAAGREPMALALAVGAMGQALGALLEVEAEADRRKDGAS